mgnify:CR=1 FL=1
MAITQAEVEAWEAEQARVELLTTTANQAASDARNALDMLKEMGVNVGPRSASIYASKTEVADLRREVEQLSSLYRDVFALAIKAVADIADAADKEDAETMGEKMLAMIRKDGAE